MWHGTWDFGCTYMLRDVLLNIWANAQILIRLLENFHRWCARMMCILRDRLAAVAVAHLCMRYDSAKLLAAETL